MTFSQGIGRVNFDANRLKFIRRLDANAVSYKGWCVEFVHRAFSNGLGFDGVDHVIICKMIKPMRKHGLSFNSRLTVNLALAKKSCA